jgi:hypothetical protein
LLGELSQFLNASDHAVGHWEWCDCPSLNDLFRL